MSRVLVTIAVARRTGSSSPALACIREVRRCGLVSRNPRRLRRATLLRARTNNAHDQSRCFNTSTIRHPQPLPSGRWGGKPRGLSGSDGPLLVAVRISQVVMKTVAVTCSWLIPFGVFALTITGPAPTSAVTVEVAVPGQADPWLAGMPDGSTASCYLGVCSVAPDQAPTHVPGLCLVAGEFLTFQVTGGTAQDPGFPFLPPDGGQPTIHHADADNGMSAIVAPISSCLGVFLSDDQPDQSPAPPDLNFGTIESRNYLSLSPALKQLFFVGDGRTTEGVLQNVVIPMGATRLYLGTMDSWQWPNNIGELDAEVTDPCGPTSIDRVDWARVKARYR